MSSTYTTTAKAVLALQEELQKLIEASKNEKLTPRDRKRLETQIRIAIDQLSMLLNQLDPIRQPKAIFDPSNPKVVGRFVSLALVAQTREALSAITPFYGSGVYAIYYTGQFEPYKPISGTETPIYVGQAAPRISNARTASEQGDKLSGRLTEHSKNISKATTTLSIQDFEYRALVVQSGWETAAEDYLIHLFHPIWNSETDIVFGLGKHGDAATTRANRRSPWDTMHPGRKWAAGSLEDAKDIVKIEEELKVHFTKHPPFQDIDQLLLSFLDELKQV